jgi:uncharacterized protein (DUF58 family)
MPSLHTSIPTEILKQVRAIEIKARRLVNEIFSGQYSSVFKGRGMEFSQVREYQAGDDPKAIDWNVSARVGHLFTKEFMEEREQTVLIMIDASKSLFFGSQKNLKSEIAAEIAALLSFSAIRNNDKVGLLIFTDHVEKYVRPHKGQSNILRMVREILTFQPEGNSTNLSSALEFVGRVLKRRAVCFLMSDFLAPLDYEKPLSVMAKKHDLTAIRITDPLEKAFPLTGRFWMQDLETGQIRSLKVRSQEDKNKIHRHLMALLKQWERFFQKHRIDTIEVMTAQPYISQLLAYFKARAKRFR